MSRLTDTVIAATTNPATHDDGFDVHAALEDVLAGIGRSAADAGGEISFHGADPIVPSTLRLGAAAGIGLVAKSVAIAKLGRMRGLPGQDISIDLRQAPHRLCPFYDRKWELLNGFPGGAASNVSQAFGFRFYRTADDRYVMPLNPYPKLKIAAQKLLDVPDDTAAVSAAIARWNGRELEDAAAAVGAVMPMLRLPEELFAEAHYREVLAEMPLISIVRIGDSAPEPLPGAAEPLGGLRALGMGHVIAGAGVGRALALHGADVLNLWRPNELEHDVAYISANVGVRSSIVDPYASDGRERIHDLLSSADVFFANRRPGYLEAIGMSASQAAALRPGIVYATASLNGETGPWSGRVGFDQSAGSLVGMMNFEGTTAPALPPILVVNDYIVSWLLTAGIAEALVRRAEVGGSYSVHVSLTRAALWILSLGIFDRSYAHAVAGGADGNEAHRYLDPELFTAQTPLGFYQGVTDQVKMSATPGRYRFALEPRGSSLPDWLARS
jgi:hypothetical protein